MNEPLASEDLPYEGIDGNPHVLTLIIGRPYRTEGGLAWRCPFAHGIDGSLTQESCGGTGPVTAILNASLTLAAIQEKVLIEAVRRAPR